MLHVAEHYGSALALCDGRLAEAEALAQRSHEWSRLLTGRDASGVYGIQMFSVRREQGRLAELAPVVRILAGEARRDGPVAARARRRCSPSSGWRRRRRRELARIAADGLERFRESLWLGLAHLPDRRRAPRSATRRSAALVYPELEPLARRERDDRPPRLVLRRGRPLPRDARRDARRVGPRGGALRARAGAQPADGCRDVARAHRVRVRALPARGGGRRATRASALLGEAAALAERHRHADAARPDPGARHAPRRRRRRCPDGLSPREAQILALVARGLSNREIGRTLSISEHTAANHIRSILRKTELREPHRGGVIRPPASARIGARRGTIRAMPLYMIERTFAEQLDLTNDDVKLIEEINADEGVRWLFSFLSADRRRTYCLYEAPSPEAIMAAARRANVPADAVVEVGAGDAAASRIA